MNGVSTPARVFLDMDGVLCDFLGGLVDLFPREAHLAGIRKIGSILGG